MALLKVCRENIKITRVVIQVSEYNSSTTFLRNLNHHNLLPKRCTHGGIRNITCPDTAKKLVNRLSLQEKRLLLNELGNDVELDKTSEFWHTVELT